MIYNRISGAAQGKRGGLFKKSMGGVPEIGTASLGYNPYPCNSVFTFPMVDRRECFVVLTGGLCKPVKFFHLGHIFDISRF